MKSLEQIKADNNKPATPDLQHRCSISETTGGYILHSATHREIVAANHHEIG